MSSRLHDIKEGSGKNRSFDQFVPPHTEVVFRYLMDTPICYLKKTDMSLIEQICNALKINIKKNSAGSRIKFFSGEHKLGTHVHNKNKGVVDPGFLVDFRDFLRTLGWKTKD